MEPLTERYWYEFASLVRRIVYFGKDDWKRAVLEVAAQCDMLDSSSEYIEFASWAAAWVDGMVP
jgi:hypothetical protein